MSVGEQVPAGSYRATGYDGTQCAPAMNKAQQITIQ